ncbi:MAG: Calx-beta domain-containing protein, partial [Planctomycetota bacterium]
GTFTVSRDDNTGDLVVNYSVGGTAAPGDYQETLTGSVTIPDGQLSVDITITPVDDSEIEPDETVILTLTADPAYSIGSPSSGTVTIADNDVPTVTLSATDPDAAEELQDTGTFTVSRDDDTGDLVVNYSVSGTAAPADYQETLTGSVTVPDGQLSVDITITPVDDSEIEGDETVILTLTGDPAYAIGSPDSGTVTIVDNDVALPVVTLSATDPDAAEELQDTGTFTFTRDDNTGDLVVNYAVSGTAAPADYEETLTGSVTILDGQLSVDITITPVDDSEVEPDETLILTLTADPAYMIGSPSSGTVTIVDNDAGAPGVISFSQFEYKGAFRVHSSMDNYAAKSASFYPNGDGGNGSLIMSGHAWYDNVGESKIDAPLKKKSDGYTENDLDVATVIMPAPTTGQTPGYGMQGMEYVTSTDTLYHGKAHSNFGYCDRDGTNDSGPYGLAGIDNRRVGEFIAEIDSNWDGYTAGGLDPDEFLITGQSWAQYGCGVTIAAFDGDSPDAGGNLPATYLVAYDPGHPMTDWDRDDQWLGAAWLASGNDSAVLIAGMKDVTNQGADAEAADDLKAWMMIYDPADLSDVAHGTKNAYDPQPVEALNIQNLMFTGNRIKSMAYDPASNRLYVLEQRGSAEGTIVHVWDINPGS